MRSAFLFLAASLLIAASSHRASAAYYSAKGMVANCNSEATYESGWCAGYLGSWADADIDMVRRKACIPSDTNLGTLKKVLLDCAFSRKWPTTSTDDTQSEIFRRTC